MKSLHRRTLVVIIVTVVVGATAVTWQLFAALRARGDMPRAAVATPDRPGEPATSDAPRATDPEPAQRYYEEAYGYSKRKNFADAAQHFQKILDEHPQSELADDAQYQKAICYFGQGDYEQAIGEFEKVKQDFPDSYLSVRAEGWVEKAQVKLAAARGDCLEPVLYDDTVPAVPAPRTESRQPEETRVAPVDLQPAELAPLVYERTAPAPPLPACGPEALKIVCEGFGIPTEIDELAELAGTDQSGTSMYGLKQAAAAKGLHAEGLQADLAYLYNAPKPVIALISGDHYVVVTNVSREQVQFTDPDTGKFAMAVPDFAAVWDGFILTISSDPDSSRLDREGK